MYCCRCNHQQKVIEDLPTTCPGCRHETKWAFTPCEPAHDITLALSEADLHLLRSLRIAAD